MKAASIGRVNYAPDTRLDITLTFPVEYDPTGATAVFEIVDNTDAVSFRVASGVDSNLAINGQAVDLRLTPSAESTGVNIGATFAESLAGQSSVNFNLDLERSGLVEYRFQGTLRIFSTHGRFTS